MQTALHICRLPNACWKRVFWSKFGWLYRCKIWGKGGPTVLFIAKNPRISEPVQFTRLSVCMCTQRQKHTHTFLIWWATLWQKLMKVLKWFKIKVVPTFYKFWDVNSLFWAETILKGWLEGGKISSKSGHGPKGGTLHSVVQGFPTSGPQNGSRPWPVRNWAGLPSRWAVGEWVKFHLY